MRNDSGKLFKMLQYIQKQTDITVNYGISIFQTASNIQWLIYLGAIHGPY
jgi:hypothetical protein